MKFIIASRKEVEYYAHTFAELPHIIISITGSEESKLPINKSKGTKDILYLFFHDVDSAGQLSKNPAERVLDEYNVFNDKQAQEVIEFVEQYKDQVEIVICQCDAGISRSAGTAAALSKIYNGDDSVIFNNSAYMPNMRVYSALLNNYHSRLERFCKEFIDDNQITCSEDIHFSNKLNLDPALFVERICEIVGYHKDASVH